MTDPGRDWECRDCGITDDKQPLVEHRKETGHLIMPADKPEYHPSYGSNRDSKAVSDGSMQKLRNEE